ncbi:hypothetical protein BC629DRAFT_1592260 [Irpex lacteus]|nr:hypothetical protein BC629DRAFT_1592260 [Irpex lacteus]
MKVARKLLLEVVSSLTKNLGRRDVSQALTRILGQWQRLLSWEEEEVARSNANDVDILIAVDTIQSDDRLFDIMLNIILESMEQSQLDAAGGFTESLFKLLTHRCKQDRDKADSPFLRLAHLPGPTITTVMTMVASMLRKEVERQWY